MRLEGKWTALKVVKNSWFGSKFLRLIMAEIPQLGIKSRALEKETWVGEVGGYWKNPLSINDGCWVWFFPTLSAFEPPNLPKKIFKFLTHLQKCELES